MRIFSPLPLTNRSKNQNHNNTYKSTTLHGIGISEMILAKCMIHFQYVQSGMQGSLPPELHAWTTFSSSHHHRACHFTSGVMSALRRPVTLTASSVYRSLQCEPPLLISHVLLPSIPPSTQVARPCPSHRPSSPFPPQPSHFPIPEFPFSVWQWVLKAVASFDQLDENKQ